MSRWPATKGRYVLAVLLRIGWRIKRQSGSHRTLARIARRTGLEPGDLGRRRLASTAAPLPAAIADQSAPMGLIGRWLRTQ
jgi:hypothetical protein